MILQPNYLVFDTETKKLIPPGSGTLNKKIFLEIGLSALCAYSSWDQQYHAYTEQPYQFTFKRPETEEEYPLETKSFSEFKKLAKEAEEQKAEVVGFNAQDFDEPLLKAHGFLPEKNIFVTYDLLKEVREATGQPREYTPRRTKGGYNLDACLRANRLPLKLGSGADAPRLYQEGLLSELVQYCLYDVFVEKALYSKRLNFVDPKHPGAIKPLKLRAVSEAWTAKYVSRDEQKTLF